MHHGVWLDLLVRPVVVISRRVLEILAILHGTMFSLLLELVKYEVK